MFIVRLLQEPPSRERSNTESIVDHGCSLSPSTSSFFRIVLPALTIIDFVKRQASLLQAEGSFRLPLFAEDALENLSKNESFTLLVV